MDAPADAPARVLALVRDPSPPGFSGIMMGSSWHTRDGLVLRPTFGVGVTHIFRTTQTSTESGPTSESSSITAIPLEFRGFIGGGLRRDLLLGAVIGLSQSPTATFAGSDDVSMSIEEGVGLGLLGASLLYFLAPDSPWHLGATVAGVAWSVPDPLHGSSRVSSSGILGSVEGGYHLWIGSRIELGLVAQIDCGATQTGEVFRISEVLVRNNETAILLRGNLSLALSYY